MCQRSFVLKQLMPSSNRNLQSGRTSKPFDFKTQMIRKYTQLAHQDNFNKLTIKKLNSRLQLKDLHSLNDTQNQFKNITRMIHDLEQQRLDLCKVQIVQNEAIVHQQQLEQMRQKLLQEQNKLQAQTRFHKEKIYLLQKSLLQLHKECRNKEQLIRHSSSPALITVPTARKHHHNVQRSQGQSLRILERRKGKMEERVGLKREELEVQNKLFEEQMQEQRELKDEIQRIIKKLFYFNPSKEFKKKLKKNGIQFGSHSLINVIHE